MRRRRDRRRGFVLLVTLVTLAIAGLLLASLANRSLTLAMQAETETAETQLHWGAVSVRQATVKVLSTSPENAPYAPTSQSLRLGDVAFQIVIENENTKLNLNRLLPSLGRDSLEKLAQSLTSADVQLTPSQDISETAFQSWGQVFCFDDRPDGQLKIDWLRNRARHLTCYGNGRIDYRNTDDRVVRALFEAIEEPIAGQKFMQVKKLSSTTSLEKLLASKVLDKDTQRVLKRWLTDRVEFKSVWLSGETRTRKSESLSVVDLRTRQFPQVQTFSW